MLSAAGDGVKIFLSGVGADTEQFFTAVSDSDWNFFALLATALNILKPNKKQIVNRVKIENSKNLPLHIEVYREAKTTFFSIAKQKKILSAVADIAKTKFSWLKYKAPTINFWSFWPSF
jgi:hypothetical protein